MSDWLTLVKTAQEWVTKPKTMCTFLIGIAILLGLILTIGRHNIAYTIDHYVSLWFLLTICVGGLLTHGLFYLGSRLKFRHRLNHLASDESEILDRFVKENASTIRATFAEPAASSLADDGILRVSKETGRVHQDVGITYYSIPSHALRYLCKRKKALSKE